VLLSPGAARRIAILAILALAGLAGVSLHAESANFDYKRGQNAEAKEDYDTAVSFYQKANARAPKDLTYRTALYRVRISASAAHVSKGRKLLQAGDEQAALVEFLHAAEIDPSNEAAQQEIERVRKRHGELPPQTETSLPEEPGTQQELDSMESPAQLKPISNEPLTLSMTQDSKVIYEAIGKSAGINVLFDPDYTSKRIQVELTNMSLLDALRVVGTMSNTFWRPVTPNTIFVAANTRNKRTDLDEQAIQTFYLSNAWQANDVQDVNTAIRTLLGTNVKVQAIVNQNAIVVRGTPDELLLAQKLVNDLDKARAEVVVDIAVLEVSKNWERTIGIQWPQSVGLALQPPTSSTSTTTTGTTGTTGSTNSGTSPSLYDLAHLKATDFAVTIGSATANLLLTDSDTKILDNPRLRATDQQKATMKIGERIPIATGSYQNGAGVVGAGVSSLVNTQFQYQDVGVNIEVTPTVHFDHDVTLKIVIEVTAQTSSVTISGVTEPILSQRKVDQVIRLREGEASILGGIQNKQDQTSWSGIPGLSSIPILKYLFGSKDMTKTDDELVFVVVPHIVRTQMLDRVNLRTIDTGAGATIELRHASNESPTSTPASSPAQPASPAPAIVPTRPAGARPNVGVVPGQSAMAAAPAALAQMRESAEANNQTANANRLPNPAASTGSPSPATQFTPGAQPNPSGPPNLSGLPNAVGNQNLPGPGSVSFSLRQPPGPAAVGSTIQVPVVLAGGVDIASVALQVQYDPAKLSLVNLDTGDFLRRDGKTATPIHTDDGPGNLTISIARPPGTAGVNGSGTICVLTFQAKAAGETAVTITKAALQNSMRQPVPATGAKATIVVQ
jgi:general secretion pathway protein D